MTTGTATIEGALAGFGLVKTGAGTLIFNNPNKSFDGITISQGTVRVNGQGPLLSSSQNLPANTFGAAGSQVDLDGGTLNNEMIVTLPVSASLPWYAAYLGIFANPLAAGAVIVGERIFRNQIEQFSSAKYKIEGTLDEPKVSFVRVFTNSMDDSDAADGQSQTKSDASRVAAQDANKGA